MPVFLDSSALAKRYIRETGSEEVEKLCREAEDIAVSVVCFAEIISALCRLRRERGLREDHYEDIKKRLLAELEDLTLCEVAPQVIKRAVALLEAYSLRTLDALQLASAVEMKAETFVSADARQIKAARQEGLDVVSV